MLVTSKDAHRCTGAALGALSSCQAVQQFKVSSAAQHSSVHTSCPRSAAALKPGGFTLPAVQTDAVQDSPDCRQPILSLVRMLVGQASVN